MTSKRKSPTSNSVSQWRINEFEEGLSRLHYPHIPNSSLPYRIGRMRVGVEIEIEGFNCDIIDLTSFPSAWTLEEDGSLRNYGKEFVLNYGITVGEVENHLIQLQNFIRNCRETYDGCTFGPRTSVHVHLDVRTMLLKELEHLVAMYVLCEDTLFGFCAPLRKQSYFCRPFRYTYTGQPFTLRMDRYAALNFQSVHDHGTVEFRHMHGTDSAYSIYNWIGMLAMLVDKAKITPYNVLVKDIRNLSSVEKYQKYICKLLGREGLTSMVDVSDWECAKTDALALLINT